MQLVFGDSMSPLKLAGLAVVLLGVAIFKYQRYKQYFTSGASAKSGGIGAPESAAALPSVAAAPMRAGHSAGADAGERLGLLQAESASADKGRIRSPPP